MTSHSDQHIGVIDIGTNSVRLLLARLVNGRIVSSEKHLITPRIGQGMEHNRLHPESMARACQAVCDHVDTAKKAGVEEIYCFATNAVRSAENKPVFLSMVKQACGLEIHILSGEEEALAGYMGSAEEKENVLVIDIGGGSTELISGHRGRIRQAISYEIGAVRLYNRFGDYDPQRYGEIMDAIGEVMGDITHLTSSAQTVIGVAGTITSLSAMEQEMALYNSELIQGSILTKETVARWLDRLGKMDSQARRQVTGLDPNRADIICYGICILTYFMDRAQIEALTVSDRDNLEGYFMLKRSGYFDN